MGTHCAGFKADGTECRAYATKSSAFCFTHDPETREQHLEAVKRGGEVARWKGPGYALPIVQGPLGAAVALEAIARKVLLGELPPHIANSAVYAINSAVGAYKTASTTQRKTKDIDSPVVLVHDDEPEHYELVWDFQKDQLEARKIEEEETEEAKDDTADDSTNAPGAA